MAVSLPPKSKKKSRVNPVETEMDNLGAVPSTSDLGELFDTSVEERPPSSTLAFTEDTGLEDSRSNMQSQDIEKDVDESSSRESTPSSAGGLIKKKKKNAVEPILEEETSFSAQNSVSSVRGEDNPMYESDSNIRRSMEAWSDAGSIAGGERPNTAPSGTKPAHESPLRPQTAPSSSPRLFQRSNKVTPLSSSTSLQNTYSEPSSGTEVEKFAVLPMEVEQANAEQEEPPPSLQEVGDFKFKEIEHEEKTDEPEKPTENQVQIIEEAILAPPQSSGEHQAYVPMEYAKECIQKVIDDMKKMKANHFEVVEKIQVQYQLIEEESQAQFNEYVIKLRGEYSAKVATIRHVLESHQTDFKQKQQFYENAIKSLREKNKSLLIEKRNYLLKAKDQNIKNEKEKNQILSDLTNMLDQKHKEYISLRQRLVDERSHSDKVDKENSESRNQLNELNSKLSFASGESNTLVEQLNNVKNENAKIKEDLQALFEKHQKLEITDQEKSGVIDANEKLIEELREKIKELESQPAEVVHIQAESVQQSALPPSVDDNELKSLREQIKEKENTIDELKSDCEEKEKDFKSMYEKLQADMKEQRNEKNILKMELINSQEKNNILHKRLETMLNEVMDSVDNNQLLVKLNELKEKKANLLIDIDEREKEIEQWREAFVAENGREPTDDERPEDIANAYEKVEKAKEELVAIDKDITVLSMLIDGTLPDDMKKQGDDTAVVDTSEELRKQFEIEKTEFQNDIENYKEQIAQQYAQIEKLKDQIKELEARQPEKVVETVTVTKEVDGDEATVSVAAVDNSEAVAQLQQELAEALQRNQDLEKENNEEMEERKKHAHKVEKKLTKLQHAHESLETEKREVESQLKVTKESNEAEIKLKEEKIDQLQKEIDELNEAKLSKLPVKAKTEIKALQEKLKQLEGQQDGSSQELLDLKTKNAELSEQIANMVLTINKLKEKEDELQKLHETDKKYKELKKKYKALEAKKTVTKSVPVSAAPATDAREIKKLHKKIAELEKQLESADDDTKSAKKDTKDSKVDPKVFNKLEKSNEMLKEKVESLKNSAKVDADKIKELQDQLKEAKAKGDDKNLKKQEKAMKDLQKKLESEEKKALKFKDNLDKAKKEIEELNKELDAIKAENKKDKDEIAKLGVAAREGLEAMEKVDELKKSNKELTAENKTLAENFNSERILRKKYYNMVEDMKGKIRVYARARPLSRSELDRGNHSIISSPDEYSLIIETQRGPKDFQYDAIFTPDDNQEKVFEDTNNLIQSAVDGYNVCIFAYGQTGSGKTFTMIGDKDQKFPGIAPRSFQAIYSLIDENKSKFSFKTSMYMLELYRDNLIDLFGDTKNPAKLDIKKDKKGMVVVIGSVVKEANSSEELMTLFEEGSSSRHVASTKMNAESSRSHLVLSIVIESTNLTSGAVTKGKLSLVDLAGSERAAKTGATAEQLKEAQSINKSLSALGDVISALSSEQSFIPYRNNKLTMLMQDSLGGNAKTLMFVNISPADYNADETVTSLTYASRVKLITNDASKNAENKEISRLKGIIAKLKKGESIDDDDEL